MNSKKIFSRVVFVVVVILGVGLAIFLLYNRNGNLKLPASSSKTTPAVSGVNNDNFFQKPGAENQSSEPEVAPSATAQNKSQTELEGQVKTNNATAADYNLLAVDYFQKGEKDKALQTVNDGLKKYPKDDSLLKTKDLIENILPNL